jgi:hypothetical protein
MFRFPYRGIKIILIIVNPLDPAPCMQKRMIMID